MARFTSLLLLAASSSVVIGGPLPIGHGRQLISSYTNTTSIASPTFEASQSLHTVEEISSTLLPASESTPKPVFGFFESPQPSPSEPYVNAETAIIIEPVQPTVFTQTAPGITFLLPDGQAIATQTPEVLLSTSYITSPTPVPTSEIQSSATSEDVIASTSIPTESQTLNSFPAKGLSSSQAEIESEKQSATSYAPPMFTYSPEEPTTAAPSAFSTILTSYVTASSLSESTVLSIPAISSATASATADQPAQNVTGMPAFTHPGAPEGTAALSSASTSSIVMPLPVSDNTTLTTSSRLVVTKTLYTTVFPTLAATETSSSASATHSSDLESSAPASSALAPSSSVATTPVAPGHSSINASATAPASAELLPSTSLPVPPVVIVTQYTTVPPLPSSALVETSVAPSAPISSSQAIEPSVTFSSSSYAASSIASSIPSLTPSATPSVQPTSLSSSSAAMPTSAVSPSGVSSKTSYAITNVEPSPTETPSPPSDAPPPPSDVPPAPLPTASTSEGPLIITPIAPSQIFTVTVTEKEKETVTATVTATVTV
ncbi:hypothetical protein SVAN01_01942 [Stagonosporopsis vannaccii]|nr:hypothetical protein SVAN01_01942 [Stagonosporopsis vannaccii]